MRMFAKNALLLTIFTLFIVRPKRNILGTLTKESAWELKYQSLAF